MAQSPLVGHSRRWSSTLWSLGVWDTRRECPVRNQQTGKFQSTRPHRGERLPQPLQGMPLVQVLPLLFPGNVIYFTLELGLLIMRPHIPGFRNINFAHYFHANWEVATLPPIQTYCLRQIIELLSRVTVCCLQVCLTISNDMKGPSRVPSIWPITRRALIHKHLPCALAQLPIAASL